MIDRQSQKSGSDSTNIQVANLVVNAGIDEKRAREICHEINQQLRGEYSKEALEVAGSRINEFENKLMEKMEKVDGALQAFSDPSFQLLLHEAQRTAAATERPVDYDVLSELLIQRFQKGEDRVARTGIGRAVEIVDKISNDALLGLTVAHVIGRLISVSGDFSEGLNFLNDHFGKIIHSQLPSGSEWVEHLDILDALRPQSFGGLKKISEIYTEILAGYVDVGIEKNSEHHRKAITILNEKKLPMEILVDHAFGSDYVRLDIPNRSRIKQLALTERIQIGYGYEYDLIEHSLTQDQIFALESIYDLYDADSGKRERNKEMFMGEWDSRLSLKILREWWDSIPMAFQLTAVGRILAHSNARRCDDSMPSST